MEGNLEGNPLHLDQLEIVEMLDTPENPILGLNVVIDDQRRLAFVSYGGIVPSHQSAVHFVRDFAVVPVDGPRFSTVVTSSAGYPLDKTYYQTVKGMVTCLGILEPGGDVIIVSECSEGFGSDEYREANQKLVDLGPQDWLESILPKTHADIDEWQTEMQLRADRATRGNLHLYAPELSDEESALTGVNIIGRNELAEAVKSSVARQGASGRPRVAVVPEGPCVPSPRPRFPPVLTQARVAGTLSRSRARVRRCEWQCAMRGKQDLLFLIDDSDKVLAAAACHQKAGRQAAATRPAHAPAHGRACLANSFCSAANCSCSSLMLPEHILIRPILLLITQNMRPSLLPWSSSLSLYLPLLNLSSSRQKDSRIVVIAMPNTCMKQCDTNSAESATKTAGATGLST